MDEQVIPILRVANAADAVAWYERLGFTKEWEHRIEPSWPAFVSIARAGHGCSYPSTEATPGRTPSSSCS
jgi:hypothetical protein